MMHEIINVANTFKIILILAVYMVIIHLQWWEKAHEALLDVHVNRSLFAHAVGHGCYIIITCITNSHGCCNI